MNHRPVNRSTFGEALIVISVVAGFFYMVMQGKLSFQNMGIYAGFLLMIVVFYMALLFCRMLFYWMTGGDSTPYPWWLHHGEKGHDGMKVGQAEKAKKK